MTEDEETCRHGKPVHQDCFACEEGTMTDSEKLQEAYEQIEMLERIIHTTHEAGRRQGFAEIGALLKKEVADHVSEHWSYDHSTGQHETSNRASEEWVHDREELIERIEALDRPVKP